MSVFKDTLEFLSENLKQILSYLPEDKKEKIEEIRIRKNLPLAVTIRGEPYFIDENRGISPSFNSSYIVSSEEIEESFNRICSGSVYAHTEEIKNGFVSLENGCRVGVCGKFSESGFLDEVTSINIRIARAILGSADSIIKQYKGGGLLIASPPLYGKTTVLRDFVRQISKFQKVCVIDSRGEIAIGDDFGVNCDVLRISEKAKGIEIALRTMNPDIIAFDEIGNNAELKAIKQSFYSGVDIVTTAHIGSFRELLKRGVTTEIIKSGVIKNIAILPKQKGEYIKLLEAEECFGCLNV